MNTVTFSLTPDQMRMIDTLTTKHGFANRSEFIRSLLRLVASKPSIINTATTHPFVSPSTKSASKIASDFKKSDTYSAEFIHDLEQGLSDSDYFTK